MKEKMISRDYEFNVLGVYNYRRPGKLEKYYSWIKDHHHEVEGDILEAGVFRGKSLLATGHLLKSIGSEKKVYGFDSFSGFPPIYSEEDDLQKFQMLFEQGRIDKDQLEQHDRLVKHRSFLKNTVIDEKNISSSETFDDTSIEAIRGKIDYLGLDNIELVPGDFAQTMSQEKTPIRKISAVLFDCDLYQSYMTTLDYVWDNLSIGGLLFFDEYYSLKFPGARIAVDEFLVGRNAELSHYKDDDTFERWIAIKK